MTNKILTTALASAIMISVSSAAFAQAAAPGANGGQGGAASEGGDPRAAIMVIDHVKPKLRKKTDTCGEYKNLTFRKMCIANRVGAV